MALIGVLLASIGRPSTPWSASPGGYAAGDLDERVEPSGPEEIRDLGDGLQPMAEQLEAARHRSRRSASGWR